MAQVLWSALGSGYSGPESAPDTFPNQPEFSMLATKIQTVNKTGELYD